MIQVWINGFLYEFNSSTKRLHCDGSYTEYKFLTNFEKSVIQNKLKYG